MAGFTPGPWAVDPLYPQDVQSACGAEIASTFDEHEEGQEWVIRGNRFVCAEQAEANARLIAAAPTMAAFIQKYADAGDAEAIAIMEAVHGR